MTIGQLARKAGVNVETVRYYQRIGLFETPPRPESGYRRYHDEQLEKLIAIRRAKQLGFSLEEIRTIQGSSRQADSCEIVCNLARQTLARVRTRIEELKTLEKSLEDLLEQQKSSLECTVLQALECC